MTKKEQIEEMAKAIPKGVDYDNNECYIIGDSVHIAKTLYNAGYRKIDEFAECRNCSAWSGTDCTRHPYTQGCLKDETKLKSQIAFFKEETERAKLSLNKKIEEYNQLSFRFCQQSYEKYKLLSNFVEKLKEKSYVNNYCEEVIRINDIDKILEESKK